MGVTECQVTIHFDKNCLLNNALKVNCKFDIIIFSFLNPKLESPEICRHLVEVHEGKSSSGFVSFCTKNIRGIRPLPELFTFLQTFQACLVATIKIRNYLPRAHFSFIFNSYKVTLHRSSVFGVTNQLFICQHLVHQCQALHLSTDCDRLLKMGR